MADVMTRAGAASAKPESAAPVKPEGAVRANPVAQVGRWWLRYWLRYAEAVGAQWR
jgi:hypothetical protein